MSILFVLALIAAAYGVIMCISGDVDGLGATLLFLMIAVVLLLPISIISAASTPKGKETVIDSISNVSIDSAIKYGVDMSDINQDKLSTIITHGGTVTYVKIKRASVDLPPTINTWPFRRKTDEYIYWDFK
jgi:hypothetical protein